MAPDHHVDQIRVIPGVVQPHRVEAKDDIPGVFQPVAPKDRLVQCFIVKDPTTQAYCLFLQLGKQLTSVMNRGKFLLAARHVASMTSSDFMICGDLEDLTEKSEFYYGRLRSNLSRTEYTLYDCRDTTASVPCRAGSRSRVSCWPQSSGGGIRSGSVKVADIGYNMTFGKPQKFECTVHTIRYCEGSGSDSRLTLPSMDMRQVREGVAGGEKSNSGDESDVLMTNYVRSSELLREVSQNLAKSIAAGAGQMSEPEFSLERFVQSVADSWSSSNSDNLSPDASLADGSIKSELSPRGSLRKTSSQKSNGGKKADTAKVGDAVVDAPLLLKTRAYVWDKQCKRYYADFNRGDIPGSAKNFQLVAGNHVQKENDKILLQFGQAGQDVFFMDYRYPLTAFEAFGICLSRLF